MDDISCDNCRGWRSTAKDLGDEKREAVRQLDAALERVKVMEAADHEVLYPPRMMEEVSRFVGAMPKWKKGSPVNIRVDEREDLRCQLNAALSHVAQLRKALDELLRWAPSGAVREQCEVALAIQAPKADTVAAGLALAEACDAWWDGKPHNGISLNIDMQQAVSAFRAAKAKEAAK